MALLDEGIVIKYDVLILTCVCHKKPHQKTFLKSIKQCIGLLADV